MLRKNNVLPFQNIKSISIIHKFQACYVSYLTMLPTAKILQNEKKFAHMISIVWFLGKNNKSKYYTTCVLRRLISK